MPRVAAPCDVREAILDAATTLMERYGYKKMTMEDIAVETQIGKATIYGYFNNKQDVALSVIDRYQKRLQEQWREILVTQSPPDQRFRQMILKQVLGGFDTAQCYRLSVDESLAALKHALMPRKEQYKAELAQLLAVLLQEGCEQGVFASDDIETTAHTILTCVSGLSPSNLSPRELGAREEIEARTQLVVEFLLRGLRAGKQAAQK